MFPLEQFSADRYANTSDVSDFKMNTANEFNSYFSQVGYNLARYRYK